MKEFPHFENEADLLKYVLNEVINNENIDITGGRVWKLTENKTAYRMIEQMGEIEKVKKGYTLSSDTYPVFYEVGRNRTIIAKETDKYLSDLGIHMFSATGVGEKYKVKDREGKEQYVYCKNRRKWYVSME